MPSYQDAQPPAGPARHWLAFTAAVAVSPGTRDRLAHTITAHRAKVGTRWRLLDATTQATLVIAFLRTNLTYAELAALSVPFATAAPVRSAFSSSVRVPATVV